MSQPFSCTASVPELRDVDEDNGEFWVGNPFMFSNVKENLSAYDRNGCFLNDQNGSFLDMSYLSGSDNRGDSRTVVATDIDKDGMPELFVRQVGGGALVVYKNNFPKTNWLTLSLRGDKSNSAGIGAKIIIKAGDLTVQRELYPVVNFLSQAPANVHVGLQNHTKVDSVKILWPSGEETILRNIDSNQHLRVFEADGHTEAL
ncbi:MAG: CRTAC1 family protein [Planctomycetota bacterium]|nr:CRTAC1 family protein [Planctomycetota bacterium]